VQPPTAAIKKPAIPVFSYFKNPVTNTIPERQINLVEVCELIKGNSFKTITHTLRNIKDNKRAKEYKAEQFDYVTFSGIFLKRTDKALQKHSGLLTVDFDNVEEPDVLKEKLLQDEYFETELMFLSPSGDGLKWVIPIDLTKATHLDYFKSISNYILLTYQIKIDPSGKDISRACFLPHDAGIYINPKYA
ncbi:MAG: BT4734/BF3469 family protein, partial [Segetibacter sp.]